MMSSARAIILILALQLASYALAQQTQKLEVGDKVPDIEMTNPDGEQIRLSDLKGHVVLLDFWASWCGPSRASNPSIAQCVEKYTNSQSKHGDGLRVFSISLDMTKTSWMSAIKEDRMTWVTHGCDFGGFKSVAASRFGVHSIPQCYLIDGEGKVIAKNLRGEELANYLQIIFGF